MQFVKIFNLGFDQHTKISTFNSFFSNLEFLDIRGMDCIDGRALLKVPNLHLKKLRYLGAEQCPRVH